MRPDAGRLPAAIHGIAVLVLAVAWQLPYFDRWISLMDEGHIFAYADLLANGGELYRDATLLPLPGAFYLLEMVFHLFGPSMIAARWIVVLEFAVLCVVAFQLLSRMGSRKLAWAGVGALLVYRVWAFPHWHMYSYSTTALFFLAVSLFALVRFFESERLGWLGLAGLLAGLGTFCKQDYGGVAILTMNLTLAAYALTRPARSGRSTMRLLAVYDGPAVLVGLLTALHFLRQGLFEEMLKQTVLNHLFGIATFEYTGLPALWPLFSQSEEIRSGASFTIYVPSILATLDWPRVLASTLYRETIAFDLFVKASFYAPYAVGGFGAVRCWLRRDALRDPTRRPSALVEVALTFHAIALAAVLSRPVDWVHVLVLYWPTVCLGVFYVSLLVPAQRIPRVAALASIGIGALATVGYTAHLGWQLRVQHPAPMASERASGIGVRAEEAGSMDDAVAYVQRHSAPGENFAVLPYAPLISFLADRPAPHRSAYILWPVEYYESRQPELIEVLEEGGGYWLYHAYQLMQFPRMAEFAPTLFAHLVDHYEIDRPISRPDGGFLFAGVVRSGDAAPRGRPLLNDLGIASDLRIEQRDRRVRSVPRANWARFVRRESWPFRHVIALRPLALGRRTVLSVPLDVEPGTSIETAVGVHASRWFMLPQSSVTFALDVVADGERSTVFSRTLDPHRDADQRGWFDVRIPLDEFAGRRVELEFSTACERPECELFEMGGWAVPRVVAAGGVAP